MPEIGRIQSTNFQALLTELGITRSNIPFALRSEVTPVVLVGGTVSFLASPTPAYAVTDFFSVGVVSAPAVNTVLADTGPLPVGPYTILVNIYVEEVSVFEFQWRNAGNSADLVNQRLRVAESAVGGFITWPIRLTVENASERFRVINAQVGGVGVGFQVGIFARI